MKKLLCAATAILSAAVMCAGMTACNDADKIYVDTNAFFAPFEYYNENNEIVGVDVDIMNLVGEKLGKEVVFENTEFGAIIGNVASGKQYDCGAAGITITEERAAQVDFSTPYFTSVQYVVFIGDELEVDGETDDGVEYVLWEQLKGKKIGVQTDTTGDLYVSDEIAATKDDPDYGFDGELNGSGATLERYSSAQLAVEALGTYIDVVVVDKLPAEYIVDKNTTKNLKCYALYYDAETATEEQYAICVTKGNSELLDAINAVLSELGEQGINQLVSKHLGLTD